MKKKNTFFALLFIFSCSIGSSAIAMEEITSIDQEKEELKNKLKQATRKDEFVMCAISSSCSALWTAQILSYFCMGSSSCFCAPAACAGSAITMYVAYDTELEGNRSQTLKEYLKEKFREPYCQEKVSKVLEEFFDEHKAILVKHLKDYKKKLKKSNLSPQASKYLENAERHYENAEKSSCCPAFCGPCSPVFNTSNEYQTEILQCLEDLLKTNEANKKCKMEKIASVATA